MSTNDDWRATQEQEIIDTTIPPTDYRESAILATLSPGNYTAIVRGKNESIGIALVEVYDLATASLDVSSESELANISTRGKVKSGDDVMIGGFILGGSEMSTVLVRALGPELANSGVAGTLPDPMLELHDSSGAMVAKNDDWASDQKEEIEAILPPTDSHESAILTTLTPGNYTCLVLGKEGATGVALVEVYRIQ